jgi:hypothetical protein
LTFTTVVDVKPPPLTVRVNAGPPVATIDGEIEVIMIPVPVKFGVGVITGTEAVTLRLADSALAGRDGVNVRVTSQAKPGVGAAGRTKGIDDGQAEFVSPFETNATMWKSAGLVPVMEKADVTLTEEVPALVRVAFMVGLVVPTATPPKFTGDNTTSPAVGEMFPVIGNDCGLPLALSVIFSVATLWAFPGGVPAVYCKPKKQKLPAVIETVLLLSKLQLGAPAGAMNTKLAAFVPVIVAFVMLSVAPTRLLT